MKCFGKSFGLVKKSHPDEEDLTNVLLLTNNL